MNEAKVSYRRKDIIKVLKYLNMMVVSLDRIGSNYENCENDEEYHKLLSDFLDDWKVFPKLSKARSILSESFSRELGEGDMDKLEREFKDLEYWSLNNLKPSKKKKSNK